MQAHLDKVWMYTKLWRVGIHLQSYHVPLICVAKCARMVAVATTTNLGYNYITQVPVIWASS
jgi:hypothetical protein